jgi:hypothetical protein
LRYKREEKERMKNESEANKREMRSGGTKKKGMRRKMTSDAQIKGE